MKRRRSIKSDIVAEALAAGKLWRAKEILSGRIASQPFSPELYEQFGALLLRMGDDLAAGKFLFLSGVRRPEYESAIQLFVNRHSRGGWQSLVASFPNRARRSAASDLPAAVQGQLAALGVPPRPAGEPLVVTLEKTAPNRIGWRGCLLTLLVLAAIGLLASVAITYFYSSR